MLLIKVLFRQVKARLLLLLHCFRLIICFYRQKPSQEDDAVEIIGSDFVVVDPSRQPDHSPYASVTAHYSSNSLLAHQQQQFTGKSSISFSHRQWIEGTIRLCP